MFLKFLSKEMFSNDICLKWYDSGKSWYYYTYAATG